MLFNEKLKLLRQSKNLTQEEFANTLGVSRVHITSLESGRVKPTQLLLNCISLAYNIDKDWLTNEGDANSPCLTISDYETKEFISNFKKLTHSHKKFLNKQIILLLELQEESQL